MSLLRIHAPLSEPPLRCQWALINEGREPLSGEGPIADLPRRADRIQLVLPAAQVLIARARLPQAARRNAGGVLAYAVEELTAVEPEANQVSWLGTAGDTDVLAIVDKVGLARWRDALDAVGIGGYEVQCETLLLPWATAEWSLAWDGHEGFVRTGPLEGAATDCGDHEVPPLSLRLLIEEARSRDAVPASIAIYTSAPDAAPQVDAWASDLGVAVRLAGTSDWRTAAIDAGISLTQERQRWRAFTGLPARLRPAGWILGAALAIHATALVIDWTSLAHQQRVLRQQMEARFRTIFPDAVAVADPALQMRRKLAEARHAAGQSDSGDFLPLIARVGDAAKGLPVGTLRIVSYDSGRMALQLSGVDDASVRRIVARLQQSGLIVDQAAAANSMVALTVRAS